MINTDNYEIISSSVKDTLIHSSPVKLEEAEDTIRHALFFNSSSLSHEDILLRRTILSFIENVKATTVKNRTIKNQYNKFLSPKPYLGLPRPSSRSKPRYAQTTLKPVDINKTKRYVR